MMNSELNLNRRNAHVLFVVLTNRMFNTRPANACTRLNLNCDVNVSATLGDDIIGKCLHRLLNLLRGVWLIVVLHLWIKIRKRSLLFLPISFYHFILFYSTCGSFYLKKCVNERICNDRTNPYVCSYFFELAFAILINMFYACKFIW